MTAYQRIVRAAKRGTGTRLSADECFQMSTDDAIWMVAQQDDDDDAEKLKKKEMHDDL